MGSSMWGLGFVKRFKEQRRRGKVSPFISIFADRPNRMVDIWTDAGRLTRPLINLQ